MEVLVLMRPNAFGIDAKPWHEMGQALFLSNLEFDAKKRISS